MFVLADETCRKKKLLLWQYIIRMICTVRSFDVVDERQTSDSESFHMELRFNLTKHILLLHVIACLVRCVYLFVSNMYLHNALLLVRLLHFFHVE